MQNGTFWLSETPDVPSFGWDAAHEDRDMGQVQEQEDRKNFCIQYPFRPQGEVARNLPTCWCKDRGADLGAPVVFVTGDFNAEVSDPLEPVKAHFWIQDRKRP